VVEIKLDGPAKNALGTEMILYVTEALQAAGGKPVLLTGTADAFSAGLDLKEVASLDASGMATFLRRLEEMAAALYCYPGPTVALVNGHAIAGAASWSCAATTAWRWTTRTPRSA